jgi:hypothetical protein
MKQLDTTKAGVRKYLDEAAKQAKANFHAGEPMKIAFVTFLLDAAGISGEERQAIGRQAMATPGWFGSGNNSACRQAYEKADEAPASSIKF